MGGWAGGNAQNRGGVLLSRAFLTRVDAITRTAEASIGGDHLRRVSIRGTNDDLDRLAATLNRMLDRIGSLMESLLQVPQMSHMISAHRCPGFMSDWRTHGRMRAPSRSMTSRSRRR